MKNNTISITSATIYGLEENVYPCSEKGFWSWDIRFKNHLPFTFNNMLLYMGKTQVEALETKRKILTSFNKTGIYENCRVPVMYDKEGIIAIGSSNRDFWIDVRNKYTIKTFKELIADAHEVLILAN